MADDATCSSPSKLGPASSSATRAMCVASGDSIHMSPSHGQGPAPNVAAPTCCERIAWRAVLAPAKFCLFLFVPALINIGIPAAIFYGQRDKPVGQVGAALIGTLFGLVALSVPSFASSWAKLGSRGTGRKHAVAFFAISAVGTFGACIPLAMGIEGVIFYHYTVVEMRGATLADVRLHPDVDAFHFSKQPALDLRYHYIQRRRDSDKPGRSLYRFTTPVVDGTHAVVNDSASFWMVGEFAIVDGRQWAHVAMRPNPNDVEAYVQVVREAETFRGLTAPPGDAIKQHLLRNKDPEKQRGHYRTVCVNAGIVYGAFWLFAVAGACVSSDELLRKTLVSLAICWPAVWVLVLFTVAASHTVSQERIVHVALWPGLFVPGVLIMLLCFATGREIPEEANYLLQSCLFVLVGVSIPFGIGAEGWHFYHFRVGTVRGVTLDTLNAHYGDAVALEFASTPAMSVRTDLQHLVTRTAFCTKDGHRVCCTCKDRCRNCKKHYWQLVLPFEEPDLRRTWLCEKYDVLAPWEYKGMAPNPTSSDWNDYAYAVQEALIAQNVTLSPPHTFLLRPKSIDHKRAYYSRYFWIPFGFIIALYVAYLLLVYFFVLRLPVVVRPASAPEVPLSVMTSVVAAPQWRAAPPGTVFTARRPPTPPGGNC